MRKAIKQRFFQENKPERGAIFAQALADCEANQWKKALKLLNGLIKEDEKDERAYRQRCLVLLQLGRCTQAIQDAHKAIELNPGDAELYHTRGVIYYQLEAYAEAITDYTQALQLQPRHVNAYINRAIATWDSEKALADFNAALRIESTHIGAYNNRAILLQHLRRDAEAIADLERVVRLTPQAPNAYCQYAIGLQRMGRHAEALRELEKALALDHRHAEAYCLKGLSLYRLKRVDDAIGALERAIGLDEKHVEAYYNLGVVLRSLGRYEEAFKQFGIAVHIGLEKEQAEERANEGRKKKLQRQSRSLAQGAGDVVVNMGTLVLQVGMVILTVAGEAAVWGANAAAPGSGAGVSVGIELIGGVCEIACIIFNQVEMAQANKSQCKRLGERVIIICNSVVGLDVTRNTDHYVLALRKLHDTLKECQVLVEKFSHKNWFQRVLVSGTDNERFKSVYEKLRDAIASLQLGLSAQQVLNAEEAQQDELVDREALKQDMQRIIQLNTEIKQQVEGLQLNQDEKHEILLQQLASMRLAFTELLAGHTSTQKGELAGLNLIPFHQLRIDRQLGQGKLGTVYLGQLFTEAVAIKQITGLGTDYAKAQFLREAQIMHHLRSRHVALFYGVCSEEDRQYLVMEYFPGGTLAAYAQQGHSLQERHQVALDIAQGLSVMHSAEVYHRDLSSSNVLIDARGAAKIADLGLAKVNDAVAQSLVGAVQVRASTLKVLSPERLVPRGQVDLEKADIYSFGVLLWELMTGEVMYAGLSEAQLVQQVLAEKWPPLPSYLPLVYRELIGQCWNTRPSQRPSMSEILERLRAYSAPDVEQLTEQGMRYEKAQQMEQAFLCYQQAAHYGSMRGRTNLGLLYCQGGAGIEKDVAKAKALLTQSAHEGHARAMVNLGIFYEKGWGGEVDIAQARHWFEKAALQQDAVAIQRLARLTAADTPAERQDNGLPLRGRGMGRA